MRQTPARYRNGYHRTPTRQQRRNRWLVYAALALLTVAGNRCTAVCSRVEPLTAPVRVALAT